MEMHDLVGRVAVITGAGSGLGREFAWRLRAGGEQCAPGLVKVRRGLTTSSPRFPTLTMMKARSGERDDEL